MSTAEERARQLIEEIRDIGNFDEFTDDREPDKINVQLVNIIAEYLDDAMRDQRHACADTVAAIENPFLLSLNEGSTSPQAARHDGFQAAKTRILQAVMNAEAKK